MDEYGIERAYPLQRPQRKRVLSIFVHISSFLQKESIGVQSVELVASEGKAPALPKNAAK